MLARGIRQLVLLLCIAVVPALMLASRHGGARPVSFGPGEIAPDSAGRFPAGSVQFVDVRSRDDYSRGHAPGAVRLNSAEWESLISGFYDAWEPGKNVIIYGRARSDEAGAVAHRLRAESRLEKIFVLKGIWEEWPRK